MRARRAGRPRCRCRRRRARPTRPAPRSHRGPGSSRRPCAVPPTRTSSSRSGITAVSRSTAPHSRSVPSTRAVLAVRNLAEHRIRGIRGDARPLQRNRVAPHGVVVPGPQHHRPVGHRGVEPARVEQPAGSHAARRRRRRRSTRRRDARRRISSPRRRSRRPTCTAAPAARPPRGHRAAGGRVRRRTTASGSRRRGRPPRLPWLVRVRLRRRPAPLRR